MAKDLTPKEFKCSYGASCPGVFELEDGRLLIVGGLYAIEASKLGIPYGHDEFPVVIERGLLDEVLKCQADDSAKGQGSSASPLQAGVAGKLLAIAAKISTQTQFGWSHPDCEALEDAARILRGEPPMKTPDDRVEGVLSLDGGCKPDERTADSAEATKPCHRCGSGGLTYSSSGNGKPGRTIICRSCGWQASFDTPERGSTNQETNRIRKASGFAQWNRASAADMQPRSRILRGPIEEAQRADTATAASDAVSLTPNSTPQEATAGPGEGLSGIIERQDG
jgi:hypothetical protein